MQSNQQVPGQSPETIIVQSIGALKTSRAPGLHRLKRGTELLDAMLEPEFHEVKRSLQAAGHVVNDELLACALLLLARLAEGKTSKTLPRALAEKGYSALRFSVLIRGEDPSELFTGLQRAVRYVEGKVCPFALTRTVLGWTEARLPYTRKSLIADFYAPASH